MRSGRKPMSAAAKAAHKEWTLNVTSAFTCELQQFFYHVCDGPVDACHIIPKRFLKDATLGWPEEDALRVIFDCRNGMAGCRKAHDKLDGPYCPVTFDQLPLGVLEFAAEHGMTWKLEKMYPPKDQVAA